MKKTKFNISNSTIFKINSKAALLMIGITIITLNKPLNAATGESTSALMEGYERIWGLAVLYESGNQNGLQKLTTTGRLQYDYSYFDENTRGYQDDTSWRRARVGIKAGFMKDFTLHSEMDLDLESMSPVYRRLTDSYIAWHPTDTWTLKLGKQSAGFTLDGATSSKKLIGIERSKVAGNLWFTAEYFPGVTISGEEDQWSYNLGIFSNDGGDEFSEAGNEKYFLLVSLGYDFGNHLAVDQASLNLDFVHNEESEDIGTAPLENIISITGKYDKGPAHLWGGLTYAESFSGNEILGLELMPFYDLGDTFQIVGRYTYLDSSDPGSLRLSRYERNLFGGRGDRLQEYFIGLNIYFYDHYLKWQNGVQFTKMDDNANGDVEYDGIGFTSAWRVSW